MRVRSGYRRCYSVFKNRGAGENIGKITLIMHRAIINGAESVRARRETWPSLDIGIQNKKIKATAEHDAVLVNAIALK